jgi:molybdopterin synthase sulfur carrier subunit
VTSAARQAATKEFEQEQTEKTEKERFCQKCASLANSTTEHTFMPIKVRIPTPLRKLTNNEEVVEVNAATIGEAIAELQKRFPGIKERLVDETGGIRRFVNVYVNEEDIRFLKNQETAVKEGDEVSIIPAIAGG